MCRELYDQRQAGAGLPVALFVVTVLSLIVLAMAQQQESTGNALNFQVLSQRAYLAAESGVQLGVGSVLPAPSSANQPLDCAGALDQTVPFSGAGLTDCKAVISCEHNAVSSVVTVTAVGQCGVGQSQAERTIQARLL